MVNGAVEDAAALPVVLPDGSPFPALVTVASPEAAAAAVAGWSSLIKRRTTTATPARTTAVTATRKAARIFRGRERLGDT
jgi:hypothetical protein